MTTQPCNTFRMEIPSGMTLPVMIAYQKAYEENREKNPLQSSENPAHHSELRLRLEQHSSYDDEQDDDGDDINSDDLESDDENGDRRNADAEYDIDDPFIDDSDMLLDKPCEVAAPENRHYFVYYGPWQGDIRDTDNNEKEKEKEKEKDSTKPAGKSKQTSFMFKKDKAATTSVPKPVPETIELSDDEDDTDSREESEVVSLHRLSLASSTSTPSHSKGKERATADERKTWEEPSTKNTSSPEHNPEKKKKSKMILTPLSPQVKALMVKLEEAVKHESFENKARFPTSLRPAVLEAGAIVYRQLNMIDDNLVSHLMRILPYNRFTLRKYIITKAGPVRLAELQLEIDSLETQLKAKVDKAMQEQLRVHQEKILLALAEGLSDRPEENPNLVKKFKWTDDERQILSDIIKNVNSITTITNEIGSFSAKPVPTIAEVSARKLMYLRLLPCWPEGWMATIEMSRQLSQYKLKEGKKVQQDETKASTATAPGLKRSASITFGTEARPTPTASSTPEASRKKVWMCFE